MLVHPYLHLLAAATQLSRHSEQPMPSFHLTLYRLRASRPYECCLPHLPACLMCLPACHQPAQLICLPATFACLLAARLQASTLASAACSRLPSMPPPCFRSRLPVCAAKMLPWNHWAMSPRRCALLITCVLFLVCIGKGSRTACGRSQSRAVLRLRGAT